ncbi:hypothetical protein CMU73_13435 [Elizabethkingia anophelis]|nr:hypothetical protein A6J37_04550 [Elizabethkingia anophelis]MDV3460767.1 hypothetical protein [Elizabethkingia anophelis]MDV3571638.1 hypothetical protein [Elizabethkingia anophelis]MDV3667977.1 hypothetical protein [Elizabethkingia anophelis]MDV3936322.1 hypothetical protein [Elizabethkingia anophelis]
MTHKRRLLKFKKNKITCVSNTPEPKPLFLILQKIYFNEILAGTKTIEYRDNSPFYASRFCTKDNKLRDYNTVIFQEGYSHNARRIHVEIKKIVLYSMFEVHLSNIINLNFIK